MDLMQYVIIAALSASILWGFEDALSKKPVSRLGISPTTIIILVVGLLPFAIVAIMYPAPITFFAIAMSAVAGLFWGAGFMLIYKSVSTENVTSTYVINEILPAIIIIFGIIGLGERISVLNAVLIMVIFSGATVVMLDGNLRFNLRLLYAVLANVSWGLFWVLMIEVIHLYGSFAEPLLVARIVAAVAVIAFFAILSRHARHTHAKRCFPSLRSLYVPIFMAALIGIVDALGNDAFGFVSTTSFVAIGAGIIAISPIFVAMLGRLFYKDELKPLQWAGFGIMVMAAIVLSLF
ncbi:EamA family transporter [Candidatus Marsarchaeota archaeon]|nr:EamA family transporter [Candidatus Marsarchaeota archaeon]